MTGTGLLALAFFLIAALSAGPAHAFTAATLGDYGNVTVMEVSGGYDAHNPEHRKNQLLLWDYLDLKPMPKMKILKSINHPICGRMRKPIGIYKNITRRAL